MNQIHLEEGAKASREPQRRLNPVLKEVVRAEVIKLLNMGIIYLISNSQWISKLCLKSLESQLLLMNNELVPNRVQTS